MKLFTECSLNENILKAIGDLGFEEPTPIQQQTIPTILENNGDLIALAQTGTGKTAGFGLPILQQLDLSERNVQAIVLSPTRELAMQIAKDLESFSKYFDDMRVVSVYGGASADIQIKQLKKGAHIVVGTPGRTLDLIKRKVLKINNIKWLVLDEADEMLNMGFKDELDSILENTPEEKQTLLFSATMPDGVRRIASNYLHNPKEITIGTKNSGAKNVEHFCYTVKASNRYLALKRLADFNPDIYGIIFCRTRHETKEIASQLMDDGYNADALHGDLSQAQRDYVMQRFRTKQLQLLVATDVAARGLDIDDLTHIINYNLPDDLELYIHRSGRTGRAGKKGLSFIITHSREGRRIRDLERLLGKKIENVQVPQGEEICEKRLYSLMDKIENIEVDEAKISPYMPQIMKKFEYLDRDELLKRFVYVEFERFLDYYKNAKDLNATDSRDDRVGRNREDKRRGSASNFSRLFINVGSKNNLKVPNLLGLINEATNSNSIEVGRVDIQRNFSFFEVDSKEASAIIEAFKGKTYGSINLTVDVSTDSPKRDNRRKPSTNKRNDSNDRRRGDRDRDRDRNKTYNKRRR
ncbi:MAG: DEAD/DEAH box helicase [Bacteroidales bacterium]|nr:DEAD/DEAH box helicase [Bacteroidales bacterium]